MRKLAAYISISLDGFYEGPDQAFDFSVVDDEFNTFSADQLDSADTLVFGRVTYDGMASYWPSVDAIRDFPSTASRMNAMPKIVVSSNLDEAAWSGTSIVTGDVAAAMAAHKSRPGGDLLVLGSPMLTANLAHLGLLDELRVMINPIAIGSGKSLFNTMNDRLRLRLLDVKSFASGNLLVTYEPTTTQRS